MQIGAGSGEDAITTAPENLGEGQPPDVDGSFAVIHDEQYLTIVYENGEFKGDIVDATLARLDYARTVAAQYNLDIVQVRCDHYTNFKLRLMEREVCQS